MRSGSGTGEYLRALGQSRGGPSGAPRERQLVTVEDVAVAAARESTTVAAANGAQQISSASLEQIRADVEYLATDFSAMTPLDALLEARRIRDLATELVERTRKPAHTAELYMAAGLSCGLLSVASFDLAIWSAAAEQSRAAYLYAELVDHRSLQAWVRGQQALIAFWSGRSRDASKFAAAGLQLAAAGTPRARLHSIAARAWSHLGVVDRARDALIAAARERDAAGDAGDDDVHDRIGGQFGWGRHVRRCVRPARGCGWVIRIMPPRKPRLRSGCGRRIQPALWWTSRHRPILPPRNSNADSSTPPERRWPGCGSSNHPNVVTLSRLASTTSIAG